MENALDKDAWVEEKVLAIADELREFVSAREVYYTENSENPYVDHLGSGFEEKDWNEIYDRILEDAFEVCEYQREVFKKALKKAFGKTPSSLEKIYEKYIEFKHCSTVAAVSHSVDCIEIGEVEEEIPSDIYEKIAQLTESEKDLLRKNVPEFIPTSRGGDSHVYIGLTSNFWHAVLDTDLLMDDLIQVIKEVEKDDAVADYGRNIDRESLKNVGNTNGRDVRCKKCGDMFENYYIVHDFTQDELNRFVVLGPQADDEYGESTRIVSLNGCPSCS